MKGFIRRAAGRIRDLTARHPVLILTAVGLLGAGGVSAGGFYAYRTYDYVQHDNDFCMSCHLMAEPFELFAQSAHRGLGCKACHQPTIVARSQMALAQVVENPDSLTAHAVVPNEACAACHIDGNPEDWAIVSQSAGHRVHLESDDASLDGLQCVQCHASGVHEFAATDKTCGQSGCHEEVEVTLGRMGDFTIHCAACHGFSRAIPTTADAAQARAALAPTENECLSCHVMRTLVEMPDDEPHDQVCATCHNPHTQTLPRDAVETCATIGCHDDVRDLTPFHRGLDLAALEDCAECHSAHDWSNQGDDCLSCHQDVFDDAGVGGRGAAVSPGADRSGADRSGVDRLSVDDPSAPRPASAAPVPSVGFAALSSPVDYLHIAAAARQEPAPRTQRSPNTLGQVVFRHANHRGVECSSCHVSTESHGAITVTEIADCRSCHHAGEPAEDCASCHRRPVLAGRGPFTVEQSIDFSVLDAPVRRDVPFGHADHVEPTCATCHDPGLTRPLDTGACATCHTEHHAVGATCMSCHEQPAATAHSVESHLTCGGAGCHDNPVYDGLPRDRQGCLACHQDLVEHRPGQECAECHALPGGAVS